MIPCPRCGALPTDTPSGHWPGCRDMQDIITGQIEAAELAVNPPSIGISWIEESAEIAPEIWDKLAKSVEAMVVALPPSPPTMQAARLGLSGTINSSSPIQPDHGHTQIQGQFHCLRCGHHWTPSRPRHYSGKQWRPKKCQACGSRVWWLAPDGWGRPRRLMAEDYRQRRLDKLKRIKDELETAKNALDS